jgi:hypothetical protein
MDLSSERIATAYRRAKKDLGLKEVDHDCPEFRAVFGTHLSKVAAEDTLREMERMGTISVAHVGADGHPEWELVEAAQAAAVV